MGRSTVEGVFFHKTIRKARILSGLLASELTRERSLLILNHLFLGVKNSGRHDDLLWSDFLWIFFRKTGRHPFGRFQNGTMFRKH